MAGQLAGKVAIVTGAAHGIGKAIAERYGKEGATVVVSDVDGEGAEAVAAGIREAGGQAVAIVTDVSDKAAGRPPLRPDVADQFGTVDVLVNNAGLTNTERHFLEGDEAWWDRIHAVNLKGSYLCGLRAAQHMARQGEGVIINLSSGGASRAHRGNAAYDATKGGIEALTRAMAVDLAPYGVRVNALIPGAINSRGASEEIKRDCGAGDPPRPHGRDGGHGRPGRLPRLGRRRLRHRPDAGRRRRHPGGDALAGGRDLSPRSLPQAGLIGSGRGRRERMRRPSRCSRSERGIRGEHSGESRTMNGGRGRRRGAGDDSSPLQMPRQSLRAGIDIGGTFTDLVVYDDATGEFVVGKTLTTPDDPSRAIEAGLTATLADAGSRWPPSARSSTAPRSSPTP